MTFTQMEKTNLKRKIADLLKSQSEINKIIVFGSFLESLSPNDIDLAVFQDSKENYLTLSLKYRRMIRDISKIIPVDIFPIKDGKTNDFILTEVENGEIIYEREN